MKTNLSSCCNAEEINNMTIFKYNIAIKNLKKASKKELRAIIKWAEKEIEEYDKLINTIKKELRGREK